MSVYAIVDKVSGVEVARYNAESAVEWEGYDFSNFNHVIVSGPVEQPAQPSVRTWTILEFLRRMTPQERIGTRTRAKTDPITEDFMDLLNRAEFVSNDDADVERGLKYLWAVGILADGRVGEILGGS